MKFKYRRADKGVLHVLIAMQFEFSYKFLCKYLKLFQWYDNFTNRMYKVYITLRIMKCNVMNGY